MNKLGSCTGVAFVVDDIHKGCNVVFRYPAPQSDSNVSAFHRLSSALVAKLFRPKNAMCNQTFELVIDDLRFISHPVATNVQSSTSASSSEQRETSMFNVIFALDETKFHIDQDPDFQNGDHKRKVQAYSLVAAQLANALLHEENRVGFVTKEVRELLHIRDELAQNERMHHMNNTEDNNSNNTTEAYSNQEIEVDPQTLIDVALGKSVLANDLKAVYHGLEEDGSVHVVINRWVQLSLTLYDSNRFDITSIRPYHTLLLLVENEKIVEALPSDSSPHLRLLIEAHNPLRDFQELMVETGIPLKQLFRLAAHLVYWGVARVIDAVTMHNVYQVRSTANLHSQSALALEFRRKFTSFELGEVLATFMGKHRISVYMNTLSQHRKLEYIHMLIWLLQHDFIVQLHRYIYLVARPDGSARSSSSTPLNNISPATTIASPLSIQSSAEKELMAQIARMPQPPQHFAKFQQLAQYFHGQHHFEEIIHQSMFLSWVGKCELLNAPPEAHVLKGFDLSSQRGICSIVINFLGSAASSDVLPTQVHVKWSMEALGHGFALDMDDADVIAGATRIYETWLGLSPKDARPKCMLGVEQEFIRDIVGQMSLIFEDREQTKNQPELLAKHASLCQKVLDLYSLLGRNRGAQLTPATWDYILRLLLGVTDCILHGTKHSLASALCGQLIHVILEQFCISLQYMGVKGDLWNMLLKFCRRWLHRKTVIEQWNVISHALTKQLMARISSDALQQPCSHSFTIPWPDQAATNLELDSSLLAYAWYRVMRVIGHPSLFVDPEVYFTAITGIRRLSEVLTHNAPADDSTVKVAQLPDVNTVLRILGPWLFDASLNRTGLTRFASCRAESVRCLGDLLCNHGGGRTKQVSWPFTVRALMAIQKALLEDDDVIVAAAVLSCSRIFGTHGGHTLRGVGVLAGSFHHAIERILRLSTNKGTGARKDSTSGGGSPRKRHSVGEDGSLLIVGGVPIINLRRACIEACSSLLTIHSHLPISLTKQVEKSLTAHMDAVPNIYSSLPRYQSSNVVTLLINYLKTEFDSANQQMSMWLLTIAVQKEALFWSLGLASTRNSQVPMTITTICSFLTKIPSRWKPACVFTALECLRYLTIVSEHLYKHVFSSCVYLISCICEFMASNAQALRTMRSPPLYVDQLIASAMGCLLEWIVTTPQLLSKTQIMVKIIATVVDCADYRHDFLPVTTNADNATRQSAHQVLEYLVKHHANNGIDPKQTLGDEEHDLTRYFVWNHTTLVGLLETDEGLTLSLRDSSGHYMWNVKPQYQYTPLGCPSPEAPLARPARTMSFYNFHSEPRDTAIDDSDPLLEALRSNASQLTSWSTNHSGSIALEDWEGNLHRKNENEVESFVALLQAQMKAEITFVSDYSPNTIPLDAPKASHSTNHARRLLSQLGFISISSWGTFFPLQNSPSLLADLRALDRLPIRETYEVISFIYIYLANSRLELSTQSMNHLAVDLMLFALWGKMTHRHLHIQLFWGLWAGLLMLIPMEAFLVMGLELMDKLWFTLTDHASLLDKSEVLIVWNECQQKYRPGSALWTSAYKLPHPKSSVCIIIDPLDEGLFCVRISVDGSAFQYEREDSEMNDEDTFVGRVLGPLQDGMVVSAEWLGPLVRQTALNAVHVHRLHLRYKHSLGLSTQSPVRPHDKRTKLIGNIIRSHIEPVLPGEFYSSLFPEHITQE
ncbi:hypothetical protein THRCLA_01994 [Thraustotheca clavata]|uniref:Rap-GAP domain-containing protein n=1 Tax=Thraustotheca clavata TaxID=74557 RepID=A0A1W0A6X4_9STRA|nr:hypothetical protein THRCLA_01994 [Thraustotheca clavata]